mgnify:CR=1 FL=1
MNFFQTENDILEFQGEYRWLSNFEPCLIILDNITYKSVEHAYMSARNDSPEWKMFCQKTQPPGKIKIASKSITDKDNWKTLKLSVMAYCLQQKFSQEPFKTKLLNTGDCYIQEGNNWGDTFWGVCLKTNKGENKLGHMIMNIRLDLQNNENT